MLKQKTKNEFNNKIKDVFSLLSVNGKYQVIGSGNIKGILYASDYDLQEYVKNNDITPLKLKQIFKDKFKEAYKDDNVYITDFKCGVDKNDEPLRWNYHDMMKGVKNGYKFEDCVMNKSTLKLDIIALINGVFVEFSENYYIKIGNKTNYDDLSFQKEKIFDSIYDDFVEYYEEENYFKALKRLFALLKLENKKKALMKKLLNIFNGELGFLNNIINNLSVLELVLEQTFKPVNLDDIHNNLQIIKQNISNVINVNLKSTIYDFIDKMCLINNKFITIELIKKMKKYLYGKLNDEALKIYSTLNI